MKLTKADIKGNYDLEIDIDSSVPMKLTNLCKYCDRCIHCAHPYWECPDKLDDK